MIQIVTSLDKCERLWKEFSQNERIWDEWDIMRALHDPARYTLHFLLKEEIPRGLIPLVCDTKDNSYELFGGCYPDNRPLWINPKDFPTFFAALPPNTAIFDLRGEHVQAILALYPEAKEYFPEEDKRYFLLPQEFNYDFMKHVDTKFSGDKRKHLIAELKKVRELQPVITTGAQGEVDVFIALCNKNFGEESDYTTVEGQQEVRRLVGKLQEKGLLHVINIHIAGVHEAIALCALYKGTITAIYSSSNNDIRNLGKLLNVETIQEGCRLRVKEVDYMMGTVWKPAWKMNEEKCYTLKKN